MGNEHASHTTSFDDAKQRIDSKYSEIEQHLLEEFVKSERSNDCQRMKDLALILSQFKVCYEITEFKSQPSSRTLNYSSSEVCL